MYGDQRGFMLTMVRDELRRAGFDDQQIDSGGLRVETTFTRKAMAAAENGVLEERPPGLKKLHAATASIDVQSGALIGFYAGQNYLQSQLNWAKEGGSPGSSFKPFALTAGLKDGFALKDTFDGNAPFVLPDGGGEVGNQGEGKGESYGPAISLITATQNSVNTAYVDLTTSMEDGPKKVIKMATELGVPRNAPGLKPFPAVALGSATVSPIDMANSYATIANGGVHHDWFTVKKVTRASDKKVLYKAPKEKNRVVSEDIASDVSYALQQTVQSGTASTALGLGRPAAAKTGTATNDNEDVSSSWFVGYTPQVSTAVMYVRGKGNQALNGYLPSFYGGDYPAATWTSIMSSLMEGVPVEDFPPPAFVDGEAPATGHAPYTPPPPEPEPTERSSRRSRRSRTRATSPTTPARTTPAARRLRPGRPQSDDPARRDAARPRPSDPGGGGIGGGRRRRGRSRTVTVAPTRADPVARTMSEAIGGPVGRHARPHRWWVPVRVLLALFAVVFALGLVHHVPCLQSNWTGDQARYGKMCYSDVPYLYTGRGYAEGRWPYADAQGRYEVTEYPVGISYLAWGAAKLTQLDPVGPPIEQRRNAAPGHRLVPAGHDDRGEQLLPRHCAAAGALRVHRDLVPGRHPSRTTVGRAVLRALARPAADRARQLGPDGRRDGRGRPVGVVA